MSVEKQLQNQIDTKYKTTKAKKVNKFKQSTTINSKQR